MASPTLVGTTTHADPANTATRTLTAPTGVSNGQPVLTMLGYHAGTTTITMGYNGTIGTGGWVQGPHVFNTASGNHCDTYTTAADSTNANLYAAHTSASASFVWAVTELSGADPNPANWLSQGQNTGSGSAVGVHVDTLGAPAKDSLFIALVDGPAGAVAPATLPGGWVKETDGTSTGTAGESYFAVFKLAVPAGTSPANQTFTFTGTAGSWETLVISIPSNAPTANAGPDQAVSPSSTVTLDGSGSFGPVGDPLTYAWSQTSGTAVTLSSATVVKPTFTAPASVAGATLVFSLVVTDTTTGETSPADSVTITVAAGAYMDRKVSGTMTRMKLGLHRTGAWVWP